MKKCTYKNYEDLPLMLDAKVLCNVLGISRSSAYELTAPHRGICRSSFLQC